MEHREADHPKAVSKMFLLQGSNKGFSKATLANSAGVSKRLMALKAGGQGDHDVIFRKFPPTPGNTKVKKVHYTTNAMCKKCAAIAHSLPGLKKMRCDVAGRGGPNSCKLLVRIRAAIE
jgi:hypothetical protein